MPAPTNTGTHKAQRSRSATRLAANQRSASPGRSLGIAWLTGRPLASAGCMASIVIRRLVEPNCVMNGTATGLGRHANPRGALQFVVKRAARYWRRDLSRQAPHGSMDMRRLPILILTAAPSDAPSHLSSAPPPHAPLTT